MAIFQILAYQGNVDAAQVNTVEDVCARHCASGHVKGVPRSPECILQELATHRCVISDQNCNTSTDGFRWFLARQLSRPRRHHVVHPSERQTEKERSDRLSSQHGSGTGGKDASSKGAPCLSSRAARDNRPNCL